MSTGDELRAAVAARRDLGPDFEDALIESFLDKMGKEVDRRVDERLAAVPKAKDLARRSKAADGQRLALAIVSLSLGTVATIALTLQAASVGAILGIWFAIIVVNGIFGTERRP
ncbi:hypothetical protein HTZ77_06130 [Nonomuraea sp. SMC257]|uniref:Uncharacterized protein n=1 Tax=Nonomuraea montanisoli TaxID=2741721 RepID=A0A7Y6I4L7_9ACTN|nr:hypothetical protein [Nonomuraea montanisoli]NUW30998.1 hypothetical protein [Nonomuraea montanisoli]